MALKHDKDGFLIGKKEKDLLETTHDKVTDVWNQIMAGSKTPIKNPIVLKVGMKVPKTTVPPRPKPMSNAQRGIDGRFIRGGLATPNLLPNETKVEYEKAGDARVNFHKSQLEQIKILKRIANKRSSSDGESGLLGTIGKLAGGIGLGALAGKLSGKDAGANGLKYANAGKRGLTVEAVASKGVLMRGMGAVGRGIGSVGRLAGKAIGMPIRAIGLGEFVDSAGSLGRGAAKVSGGLLKGAGMGGSLLKGASRLGGGLLKRVPVLGSLMSLGMGAFEANGVDNDNTLTAEQKSEKKAGVWGKAAGGLGGAMAGAALGTALIPIPVLGTLVGAIVGGIGGEKIGSTVGTFLYKKDWKDGWDSVRNGVSSTWSNMIDNMSSLSKKAWDEFSKMLPSIAGKVEAGVAKAKEVAGQAVDKVKGAASSVTTTVGQTIDAGKATYNGQDVQGANADGSKTIGQRVGGAVGRAGNKFKEFVGALRVKKGQLTGGGEVSDSVITLAKQAQMLGGNDFTYVSGGNDKFHQERLREKGKRSHHTTGSAVDLVFKSAAKEEAEGNGLGRSGKLNRSAAKRYDEIKGMLTDAGLTTNGKNRDIELLDEYNHPSGKGVVGHIHAAFRNDKAKKAWSEYVRSEGAVGMAGLNNPSSNDASSASGLVSNVVDSVRGRIRAAFGKNPRHSADKNADIKKQGAKRADAALDFSGGVIKGLSDIDTRALMASKQETEASFNPKTVSRSNYLGLYQFGAAALEDVGMLKKGASKAGNSALNDSANWNINGGKDTFLNDKNLQDKMAVKYANILLKRGMSAEALNENSSAEEKAGYIKAAWLKGNGGANNLVLRGKDSKDGMGTSTQKYYNDGVNAIRSDAKSIKAETTITAADIKSASVPAFVKPVIDTPTYAKVDAPTGGAYNYGGNRGGFGEQMAYTKPLTQRVENSTIAWIASGGIGAG